MKWQLSHRTQVFNVLIIMIKTVYLQLQDDNVTKKQVHIHIYKVVKQINAILSK